MMVNGELGHQRLHNRGEVGSQGPRRCEDAKEGLGRYQAAHHRLSPMVSFTSLMPILLKLTLSDAEVLSHIIGRVLGNDFQPLTDSERTLLEQLDGYLEIELDAAREAARA